MNRIGRNKLAQVVPLKSDVRSEAGLVNRITGRRHSAQKLALPGQRVVFDADEIGSAVVQAAVVEKREIGVAQLMRCVGQK